MIFSAVSAVSAWDFIGPGSEPSRFASATRFAGRSSLGTGPAFRSTPISGSFRQTRCALRSCAVGSHARTSALPGGAPGCAGRGAGCGRKWCAWSASADRIGSSLRTSLACEAAARTGSSLIWRRSATEAGRSWWVLSMPARHTGGGGCSWSRAGWLPTPVARDWKCGSLAQRKRRRSCQLSDVTGGLLSPAFVEWMMGFPDGWTA